MIEDYVEDEYPKTVELKDGRQAVLRLLSSEDEEKLIECFKAVPVAEQVLLRDDVTDPAVVREWCRTLDFERVVPLIAEADGKIVADATLHRTPNRWTKHAALVRIVVHPSYRRVGLARTLLTELGEIALHAGIALLNAECVAEEQDAIALFKNLGYTEVALMPHYVRDAEGHPHDLVILINNFREQEDYGGTD